MQETLNCKKHGDTAFRAKDFATAIDRYTKVSPLPSTNPFGLANWVHITCVSGCEVTKFILQKPSAKKMSFMLSSVP